MEIKTQDLIDREERRIRPNLDYSSCESAWLLIAGMWALLAFSATRKSLFGRSCGKCPVRLALLWQNQGGRGG